VVFIQVNVQIQGASDHLAVETWMKPHLLRHPMEVLGITRHWLAAPLWGEGQLLHATSALKQAVWRPSRLLLVEVFGHLLPIQKGKWYVYSRWEASKDLKTFLNLNPFCTIYIYCTGMAVLAGDLQTRPLDLSISLFLRLYRQCHNRCLQIVVTFVLTCSRFSLLLISFPLRLHRLAHQLTS
jgi:hypothetical protein